jgi:prephenate dehydratase
MKVAIQGELGSFSHEAARQLLPRAQIVPCANSAQVFDLVANRGVAAAVVPIENSLAGAVSEHYDLLLSRPVTIEQEFHLRIAHTLIAPAGVGFAALRRAYSHPVALGQCREFFRANPQIVPMPFYDTAGSAKHVIAEKMKDAAAIAGAPAAQVYGGRILRRGLEDDKQNFTRFFVIRPAGAELRPAKGANKTSIAFALKNLPGVLFRALSVFALRDIDLSRIESRPLRGHPWEYVFYVDFLRGRDEAAENALRHLGEVAEFVKVLGVYPAARDRSRKKTAATRRSL